LAIRHDDGQIAGHAARFLPAREPGRVRVEPDRVVGGDPAAVRRRASASGHRVTGAQLRRRDHDGGTVRASPDPEQLATTAGEAPSGPGELVDKLDALVQPAREPENAVLTDDTRLVRWTGPLFALFSLILLPWTVYLGESLPARQESPHYDIAWTGFDLILLAGLASTAYFALRRSRYLAISAAATGALLVVDAWFDIMTTPASQVAQSILLAAAVELPLAAVCLWLSLHTEQLTERRITLLLARRRRTPPRSRTSARR
jgi:hypothetical protein